MSDSPANRRAEPRLPVNLEVDCSSGDIFLYAYITDISSLGIFIETDKPLPVGTSIALGFTPAHLQDEEGAPLESPPQRLELAGEVVWNTSGQVNPDKPGMGVRFHHTSPKTRARLLEIVRAIAYLDDSAERAT